MAVGKGQVEGMNDPSGVKQSKPTFGDKQKKWTERKTGKCASQGRKGAKKI